MYLCSMHGSLWTKLGNISICWIIYFWPFSLRNLAGYEERHITWRVMKNVTLPGGLRRTSYYLAGDEERHITIQVRKNVTLPCWLRRTSHYLAGVGSPTKDLSNKSLIWTPNNNTYVLVKQFIYIYIVLTTTTLSRRLTMHLASGGPKQHALDNHNL